MGTGSLVKWLIIYEGKLFKVIQIWGKFLFSEMYLKMSIFTIEDCNLLYTLIFEEATIKQRRKVFFWLRNQENFSQILGIQRNLSVNPLKLTLAIWKKLSSPLTSTEFTVLNFELSLKDFSSFFASVIELQFFKFCENANKTLHFFQITYFLCWIEHNYNEINHLSMYNRSWL